MTDPQTDLAIAYAYPEWCAPLFSELERHGIDYLKRGTEAFDPTDRSEASELAFLPGSHFLKFATAA